jgi:hypothetical protein
MTGRVSPQFHVQFDPRYQTIRQSLGGTQPLSKWQALCGFLHKKGKSEAEISELDLPAPDPQVLGELVNARGNSNVPPIPQDTNHARVDEAGVVGTASDVPGSSNRSHFSDIYFDNEDNFQEVGAHDEQHTDQEFAMFDYIQDGRLNGGDQRDQRVDISDVKELDGGRAGRPPTLRRSNCTSVPIIGRRLMDGFLSQVVLFTTLAISRGDAVVEPPSYEELCRTREEDDRPSAPAVGELYSLQASMCAYRSLRPSRPVAALRHTTK